MTEAVQAMCNLALQQNCATKVIAETKLDAISSQKILKRCGFNKYQQSETAWWKLQL